MTTKRLTPKERTAQILAAAITLAEKPQGFQSLTRENVATAAGCTPGLITRYYGTAKQLRRAVMRAAVKAENVQIIAQGIGVGDAHALKAPDHLKNKAAASLIA